MLERIISRLSPLDRQAKGLTEISARAFKRETLLRGEQKLELISLEARFIDDERVTPPDWREHIAESIKHADLVFVEYFPPELEEIMPYLRELGEFSRSIAETYDTIADIAQELATPVAIADIANKPLYEAYHLGIYPIIGAAAVASAYHGGALGKGGFLAGQTFISAAVYQSMLQKGKYGMEPGFVEQLTPDATDARRVLTARGIAQTSQNMPPDSSLLYIAAPAHIVRVKTLLTEPKTVVDSAKALVYKQLAGLDRTTRIYTPNQDGWELASSTPIR